ncbi:MAG: exodeoxyribonuclease VII small subunit [Saccharofermentanaceae bacterium]|jgi:exodeoxyribonuclease VII small subunit|nr:exodeoxyribonuclease VII small subunit [Clostridia bacterium]NLX67986.1 exodeoxyribonuclease VII small subunit [Clostridiaceae bacterium]HOO48392.1 exodeoxyribonuclease VII small subunit [Saccharofermentans sp.]HPG64176.1 exodeoxyribonuclease VII small subunit [Saccharofermentans sp.]HPJ81496.1 exodeoxyribonuclease VII small subunit [Saccharofermentans sp.]
MASKSTSKEDIKYEDAIAELEAIVNQLSEGNVPLDKSLQLYSRGVELTKLCEKKLKEVEQKISILNKETNLEEPFLEEEIYE